TDLANSVDADDVDRVVFDRREQVGEELRGDVGVGEVVLRERTDAFESVRETCAHRRPVVGVHPVDVVLRGPGELRDCHLAIMARRRRRMPRTKTRRVTARASTSAPMSVLPLTSSTTPNVAPRPMITNLSHPIERMSGVSSPNVMGR